MHLFITLLLMTASTGAAAGNLHYLELVNTAPARIVAFSTADAGSEDWRDVSLETMGLRGGGDSTTIGIEGGCRQDLRATFVDGRVLIQRGFNVCRYRSYHTGQHLRRTKQRVPHERL